MTTSTEQLNAAILALHSAASAYNGKVAEIDETLKAAADRWDSFETSYYVDQAAGDDDFDGTAASPLASIQAAINRAPFRSRVKVFIRGQYTTTAQLHGNGRDVVLVGAGPNWETTVDHRPDLNLGYGLSGGYSFGVAGPVSIRWCIIDIPETDWFTYLFSRGVWLVMVDALTAPQALAGKYLVDVLANTPSEDVRNITTNIQTL
ncbi:hypothetical protein [Cribrihabitans neustonicus]|uniref:hypothetical protein n=1 Tax=Cribrihabitans neustonicus TaxID=1429085 RepID=UPI003B5A2F8A